MAGNDQPESSIDPVPSIDLREELPVSGTPSSAVSTATASQQRIAQQRENNRGCIGQGVMLCLLALVFGSLWMVATDRAGGSSLKDVLDVLAPALSGIIGAVAGFFFATERTRAD